MSIFIELSLLIVLATIIAGIMRILKQPLIMGHILTGLIVGPLGFGLISTTETIEIFSEFGVSILLFIVGLHLSPKVAREVGKAAIITGLVQMTLTAALGFFIATLFGYNNTEAGFIGMALAFSSTIIVLKLLTDKKEIEKLYAKIAIGVLLVQDVIATIALIFVATVSNGSSTYGALAALLIKGILLIVILGIIGYKILPKLSDFFAESQEYLFLFSIGWGFGLASLFSYIGFSIEIGALIAGVALSVSPYNQEISSKLKPLRDFFTIMFFVSLGVQMDLHNITSVFIPAVVLAFGALTLKPLILIVTTDALNYNKRTNFFVGTSLSQISEFSLILVLLGHKVGLIHNEVLAVVTLTALITFTASTYIINYSEKLYPIFAPYLAKIERKKPIKEFDILGSYDVVLFGANRAAYDFLRVFKKLGQSFLVVDFDPKVIKQLTKEKINCRYGDAEDSEFLEELNLGESKMIISTIPDHETNEFLLTKIKQLNKKVAVILISYDIDNALSLYKAGADYIIMPHFIGGHFAAMLAHKHWPNVQNFRHEKKKQVKYLRERKKLGHKHPQNPSVF